MPARHVGRVTGVRQLVSAELPHGLEHPEPGLGAGVVALDEMVVEQDRQPIDAPERPSVSHTASAASRFQPPENIDSWR